MKNATFTVATNVTFGCYTLAKEFSKYENHGGKIMEVEKRPVNGFGIASLVFGIVGILTICGCGIGFFFGLFGVILGILGLTVLKKSGKGLAIAGLIVSGVALICGTFWMVCIHL